MLSHTGAGSVAGLNLPGCKIQEPILQQLRRAGAKSERLLASLERLRLQWQPLTVSIIVQGHWKGRKLFQQLFRLAPVSHLIPGSVQTVDADSRWKKCAKNSTADLRSAPLLQ